MNLVNSIANVYIICLISWVVSSAKGPKYLVFLFFFNTRWINFYYSPPVSNIHFFSPLSIENYKEKENKKVLHFF